MKQEYLKTQYEYLEDAKRLGAELYRNLSDEKQKELVEKLIKRYKVQATRKMLENAQEEGGLLKAEILAFLPDFVGRQEALRLFQYKIWASFSALLSAMWGGNIIDAPNKNSIYFFFQDYIINLQNYEYKPSWFVTELYKVTDFEEVLDVEKYCLLKRLEHIFADSQEDLPVILEGSSKVKMSLTKAIYKLEFLNTKIDIINYSYATDPDDDIQKHYRTYLKDTWLQNDEWFLCHAPSLKSIFAKDLQERLASFQLEIDIRQKNALIQKSLSYHDLHTYIQHYKSTNKIKQSNKAKIMLQMQSGSFSMEVNTLRYWWRLITFACLGSLLPISILHNFFNPYFLLVLIPAILLGGITSWVLSNISQKIESED